MRTLTNFTWQLALIVLLMTPLPALAIPAITCHCFQDRSYDPSRPAVADPYFLATTQNSFFAAAFGVEKRSVVMMKQKGTASEDLWISHWLAARSGEDAGALLQERQTKGSWRQVATRLALPAKSLGGRVAEVLKGKAGEEQLANAVVDELLVRFRFHREGDLAVLRKGGASSQELVLAGMLAAKTGKPAARIYSEVKKGSSWGALLQQAKIETSEIQPQIAALVKGAAATKAR